jgi:dTDP-4-dehydrorhamnose reductase
MILIVGGSGFVGQNLTRFFKLKNLVTVTYLNSLLPSDLLETTKSIQLDIRDINTVLSTFDKLLPEVVIHAAGNKNVRYCESHPEEAYQTNALGTRNVARACHNVGARMIYISTDLVFSGTQGSYKETDLPLPSLVYGKTKLKGEEFALQELEDVAICRSGGIYGKNSPLLRWLATELNSDRIVECFTDVFNTPTYVENLAEMIENIIPKKLTGVFHTVGRERVNRFEFFNTYASLFGLNVNLLSPAEAGDRRTKMLLQPDASLSIEQTIPRIGVNFNSVTEGFTRLQAAGGI